MDRIQEYKVGDRIDKVVTSFLQEDERFASYSITRSNIEPVMSIGVSVNGKGTKRSYKLKEGDVLEVEIGTVLKFLNDKITQDNNMSEILSQKGDLHIIFENEDFMIVNKAKGLVVHPGVGNTEDTLANYVRGYLEEKGEYDIQIQRAGIVHRLDKGVSGLMVIAKNWRTQAKLKAEFENHRVNKVYVAKVVVLKDLLIQKEIPTLGKSFKSIMEDLKAVGHRAPELGWYVAQGGIVRDSVDRQRMRFRLNQANTGKRALSYVAKVGGEGLLAIKIETGRMHQIRATLRTLGWVIIGDKKYGYSGDHTGSKGIELESRYLNFSLDGEMYEWAI